MKPETLEYINTLFGQDIAEKRRMMMDAINNGFDEGIVKNRIESYQRAYNADKDFSECWEDNRPLEGD